MKTITKLFLYLSLLFSCSTFAQDSLLSNANKLTPAEITNLRELLKEPAPTGGLQQQIDAHFRKLDAAAFKLGDMQERERVLKEWNTVSKDLDARWTYASFLLNTEKIQEGFIQFENLIKDIKNPQEGVRARARLAINYIDQSNLKRAEELLNEAEEIIKTRFVNSKNQNYAYWFIRAEMEYFNIRARLLLRQGKFEQSLEASRIANLRGIELQKYEFQTDERQKIFSRSTHAWVLTETAMIQIAMGRLYDADETLRIAYNQYKQYGLTEASMIDFYRRVGDLRFNQGLYDEAIKIYKFTLSIQSNQGYSVASPQIFYTRNGIIRSLTAQKNGGST
jgi:tetratricopeptide (TPR) repeat protein